LRRAANLLGLTEIQPRMAVKMRSSLMQRFFENKLAFAAVVVLFALAFGWNLSHATPAAARPDLIMEAVGPSLPPPPWEEIQVAVGPSLPPPPWEEIQVAVGPSLPPPPWEEIRVAVGPSLPPPPWEEVRTAL
jgi:hypothetical protein